MSRLFSSRRTHDGHAVVTGAGSGIGAAFARRLAQRGNQVLCSDIDEIAAQRTVEQIHAGGGAAQATRCDVRRLADVEALADTAQTWFGGPPTVVVNNAGVGAGGRPIGEIPMADWEWTLGVNLWGPIHGCHVFAPILRDADGPRGIINVASAASFGAAPGMAAYNVSKAAVLSLSETLAAESSGTGLHVTVLCPTFVKTKHRRRRPHHGRFHPTGRHPDALDRIQRRPGGAHVPGHPRPRRAVLHATARRPDRLGYQTSRTADLHPHSGVGHPNRQCCQLVTPHNPRQGVTMAMNMDTMLAKIKDRQWALADIDWDAPGAETISDEFRPKLKAFMADLCWIENVGARGFAAMAKKAPTPTLAEIYRYFHAEEQRHANAELALMKRWGMLDEGEMPEPNVNIRLAIEWLDRYADGMSLSILGTVIPMLEVALDGALLKFLLDEVDDPVCHQVFEKINNDESRHIAVDFEVLNMIGYASARKLAIEFVGNVATPGLIIGALMYVPLLNRMRNNIVDMGLEPERLYKAMLRFKELGGRSDFTWRVPTYQILKLHSRMVVNPRNPYHWVANPAVWVSDRYPRRLLRPIPTWFKELTHEPAA